MRLSAQLGRVAVLVVFGLAAGLGFGLALRSNAPAVAQAPAKVDEPKPSPDEADVHKTWEAFAAGFNDNDAKKAAAAFTTNAEFIDDDGNRIEGAKEIEALLTRFFAANKGAKLQITPDGVRTVAPGVALEDGESVVTNPDKKTQSARRFSAVFAKVDGAWKIASIREYPEEPEVITAEERLKDLEWFIGEWVDEGGDSLVQTVVTLSPDKSHMLREFSVLQQGKEVLRGTQRIGVDPLTGYLRGWSFDSAGGYGESSWTKNGDTWVVRGTGVTSEGEPSAATYIIKPLGKDRIELKSVNKVVGDTVEADTTAILVRKPAPAKK